MAPRKTTARSVTPERTIDGFLAGLPYEKLLPALHEINVNPLERPIVDIGL